MPEFTFVTLAGDFNQLSITSVELLGLMAEFHEPTHVGHRLYRLYSTVPVYINCVAIQTTVFTAHKAIIARPDYLISKTNKITTTRTFRSHSLGQHAQLMRLLADISWDQLLNTVDVQDAFVQYYVILWNLLEIVYPQKSITLTNCDPKFITPQIKSLLRTRNRLKHKGKTHAADSITTQISRKIVAYNASVCHHTICLFC